MSGEEKAAQIGAAVSEYQAAKIDLAHIDKKVEMLAETYLAASQALRYPASGQVDNVLSDATGELHIRNSALLLDQVGLIRLLGDRLIVKQRLVKADKEMKALGITGLQ